MNDAPQKNPWLVLMVFSLGLFMTLLDLTIVNIAIPSIVDDLKAPLDGILWMLNAYSLVYAVLLITSARLGDMFGPRALFVAGVGTFTVASALSGLAQDPTQLILARAAQGLGAALIAPQGLPMITSLFAPEKRGGVFAIFGILAGLAVVLGPTLGGLIVSNFGWRWIFYVNIPIGVALVIAAFALVPDLRVGRSHRLDIPGVALASGGLLLVVYGLIEGQRFDWGTVTGFVTIPEIIAAGIVLLALFMFYERGVQDREPLLPFAVFENRNFTLMVFVLMAMGFAILGVFLPLTIYFQSVLGFDAFTAGLTIAPMPLAMMIASGFVASQVQKVGPKPFLFVGLMLFTIALAFIAWSVSADGGRWALLPGLILMGIGMSGVWTPVYDLATRDLKPELAGTASGVLNTMQELGTVIASAAIGAVLQNQLATSLRREAVAYSAQLPAPFQQPFINGFADAGKQGLEVGAGQNGAALQLPPGIPQQVADQLAQLGHAVFTHAFVDAMRPSMALPIGIVIVAALLSLAARAPRRVTSEPRPQIVAA
ncbi:MAG TPA: DHA2 family efflux MFS transporter permease subunit [Candidatus Saccharimonadales bacterium]|jgi:EmrB/QacA subfamily drug resistance transporter|nr:DHA2 family efflux MFS transporter permease subunit [Candidatus Saccharimonadales bacterium]